MQKIIFLTCFVLEITRGGGGVGNFYPHRPNHLRSIKTPNQNRVKLTDKLDLKRGQKSVALSNFSIYDTWEKHRKLIQ